MFQAVPMALADLCVMNTLVMNSLRQTAAPRRLEPLVRRRAATLMFAALVLVALSLGVRPVVEYADLTCPSGTAVRYRSVSSLTAYCAPTQGSAGPTTVPLRRYFGLFFTTVDVRVFDVDLGTIHGPALGVRLGR